MENDPTGLLTLLHAIASLLGLAVDDQHGLPAFFVNDFYPRFRDASTLVCLILVTGIIYTKIRLRQVLPEAHHAMIAGEHHAHHGHEDSDEGHALPPDPHPGRIKWQGIMKHLSSTNPGDWRLAVLEADILLDTFLEDRGVPGLTIGERLKVLTSGDMKTLNQAWEAHKIRNAIAHQGSDFLLSEREARRVITLYREVFEEFDYI